MRLFKDILHAYGRETLQSARQWESHACKESETHEKLAFLHNCLHNNLIIKSLRYRPVINTPSGRDALRSYQKQVMRAMIQDCHHKIQFHLRCITHCKEVCREVVATELFDALLDHIERVARTARLRKIEVLRRKTDILKKLDNRTTTAHVIHNLSERQLTGTETKVLQRDLGFNTEDAKEVDFMASVEPTIYSLTTDEDTKNDIRQSITGLLSTNRRNSTLPRAEFEALSSLRRDRSIVILPADKGRATVVLDRPQYNDKVRELLDDTESYQRLPANPTSKLCGQITRFVNQLVTQRKLTKEEARRIKPSEKPLARFYGLPKVHKAGVPLRPIVSLRGSSTYDLAKWLAQRLTPLTRTSTTTVKSSVDFLERIKAISIGEEEVMMSYDVRSLFTSIPQQLAIDVIRSRLQSETSNPEHTITVTDVISLVNFCFQTVFTFDLQVYRQVQGTPMGSPLSGVIAELVLQDLEEKVIPRSGPTFWARYVDDTFVVVERKKADDLLHSLNSYHPSIQFTMEAENDGKLPFLDVLVSRTPTHHLQTTVYRKPTNTDRMLHFDSNHPTTHKVSCIRTLFQRIETHCSTPHLKEMERKVLYRMCRANGYDRRFVERCIRRSQRPPIPKPERWVSLPYVRNVSEATARTLQKHGVRVAHKPARTIRDRLVHPKDTTEDLNKAAVVYKIPCNDCNKCYIGETARTLGKRIEEHRYSIRRHDTASQMWQHMADTGHTFALKEAQVIDRASTKGGRLFKEAWHSEDTAVNRHIELSDIYLGTRNRLKVGSPSASIPAHLHQPSTSEPELQPAPEHTAPERRITRSMTRQAQTQF